MCEGLAWLMGLGGVSAWSVEWVGNGGRLEGEGAVGVSSVRWECVVVVVVCGGVAPEMGGYDVFARGTNQLGSRFWFEG